MNIDENRTPTVGGFELDWILLFDWKNGKDRSALAQ